MTLYSLHTLQPLHNAPSDHPVKVAARIANRTADLFQLVADAIEDYDIDDDGIVRDFGQFEHERTWAVILWQWSMDQFADATAQDLNAYKNSLFDVTPEMRVAFPDLASVKAVCIWQDDLGFIHTALSIEHDAETWAALINQEADQHLGLVCEHCAERMGYHNTKKCEHCGEFSSDLGPDLVAYDLPAYWASYLINGDASSLTDEEQAQCDAWIDAQEDIGGPCLDCSDNSHFRRSNDAIPLGGDVLTYVFPKAGGRLASK